MAPIPKRIGIWRRKLIPRLIGLALGGLAGEAMLRLAGVSYPQPYAPDPYCGPRLRPGFEGWWRKEGAAYIQINRDGFRHGERSPAKPPGKYRVAVAERLGTDRAATDRNGR